WEVREVSLTPIGADKRAKIRGTQTTSNPETPMNPKLRKYLETLGLRAEATDQEAQDFYSQLGPAEKARADAAATAPDQPPVNQQRSEPPATQLAPPASPAPPT